MGTPFAKMAHFLPFEKKTEIEICSAFAIF